MSDEALTQALSRALLVLRITLGLFLLQWGVEKFVVPQNTVVIWGYFYGLNVPQTLGYVFGAVEIAIAGCLLLGLFRTAAYGAARRREPFVHRQRTRAGRPDRAVPAAALGPRHPGDRRVICRILTKRREALQAGGLDLPVAVQSAAGQHLWVRSCTSGFDAARLPTLKGAAIRV